KHDSLARGPQDRHSSEQAARVTGHVGLDLAKIHAFIGVNRSGYRGEDAFEQHLFILEPWVRTQNSSLLRLAGIVPADRGVVWWGLRRSPIAVVFPASCYVA